MFKVSQNIEFFSILIASTSFLVVNIYLYLNCFYGLSGDDFFRALMAYEWSANKFFVTSDYGFSSVIWFPIHFWISGFFIDIFVNIPFSLKLTSVVFSIIEFILFFLFVKELFNRITAVYSTILLCFIPFHIWLNFSMTVLPLYLASLSMAFLFYIKWLKKRKVFYLYGCAFSFFLCTLFRPEGWIFAFVFIIFILLLSLKNFKKNTDLFVHLPFIVIIPLIFISFWLFYNHTTFGHPFYFVSANIKDIQALSFSKGIISLSLLFQPFNLFICSPFIILLFVLSFFIYFKDFNHNQRLILTIAAIHFLFITFVSSSGPGTTAAPQRLIMGSILLFTPFSGWVLFKIRSHRLGKFLSFILVIFYVVFNTYKASHFPRLYIDEVHVGKYLSKVLKNGSYSYDYKICSELYFYHLIGKPLKSPKHFIHLSSSHAAIASYSNQPRLFYSNVLQSKFEDYLVQGDLNFDTNKITIENIKNELNNKNINIIILSNRNLMVMVPKEFSLTGVIGKYSIFTNNIIKPNFSWPYNHRQKGFQSLNYTIDSNLTLNGYKFFGTLIQDGISLKWTINNPVFKSDYKIIFSFSYCLDKNFSFKKEIKPIFTWFSYDLPFIDSIIYDKISIVLPNNLKNGKYNVKMSIYTAVDDKVSNNKPLLVKTFQLKPMYLIKSKRDVVFEAALKRNISWKLLSRTLFLI